MQHSLQPSAGLGVCVRSERVRTRQHQFIVIDSSFFSCSAFNSVQAFGLFSKTVEKVDSSLAAEH